ncbi:MAG: hypothetical protein GY803_05040 [Chloroflexi bacterium]|nr:hypothetical protein [Chloroflexota bacterium]
MTQTITMIDYGGSNIRSVQKAFEFVGATMAVIIQYTLVYNETRTAK